MFTVPGTFTEADDIRHMAHATTRSVTWRGIELTVRLPPPGDASCPRCAGNNKRAHECSLSRSGMSAALKAADKRLKAAERAEAAAKADAEPERPKRFAVSGVPPLQLIAHDFIVRCHAAELERLHTAAAEALVPLREAWARERRAALREARASNGHQVGVGVSEAPFQYGHHGCGDAPECMRMHVAEAAIRIRSDAEWRAYLSRQDAQLRAADEAMRARHAMMLEPTRHSVAANYQSWLRCAKPNCGAFFTEPRGLRVRRQCWGVHADSSGSANPGSFCVCDVRMDLCAMCLPVRNVLCALCDELFCSGCAHGHRLWCAHAKAGRCGLAPDNASGGGCKRWAAGHCRSPIPFGTELECTCGTLSCASCVQPCGYGGALPHRVGRRRTCSGHTCWQCARTHTHMGP